MKALLVILFFGVVLAAKQDVKKDFYKIPGMTVSKADLVKFLADESPKEFCSDSSHFIKCFDIVQSQCPQETKQSISTCKTTISIPERIDVLELEMYSAKLGECVGNELEKKWIERKRGLKICKTRF